jgi:hypothetical protein
VIATSKLDFLSSCQGLVWVEVRTLLFARIAPLTGGTATSLSTLSPNGAAISVAEEDTTATGRKAVKLKRMKMSIKGDEH